MNRCKRTCWKGIVVALLVAVTATACSSRPRDRGKKVSEKTKRMVSTNIQMASIYLKQGKLVFAKEKAEKAIAANPADSDANNMMALLSWRLKEYKKTDKYFRKAIRYQADNASALNNCGVFLCEKGEVMRSVEMFNRASKNQLYGKRSQAMVNAGRCLLKIQDMEKAEDHFRRALTINPNTVEALFQLAKISFSSERLLTARGFLKRYFDTGRDSAESLYLAVRLERVMGDDREMNRYARRLRVRYPKSMEASRIPGR